MMELTTKIEVSTERFLNKVDHLAQQAANASADVTLSGFRTMFDVTNKLDDTRFDPVTQCDQKANSIIRDILVNGTPRLSFVGEESGFSGAAAARYQWHVDPIDGKPAFLTGNPLWGTLITLSDWGSPIFGLIDMPVLGERFISYDSAAFMQSKQGTKLLITSSCQNLEQARTQITDPFSAEPGSATDRVISTIVRKSRLARFGGDCYNYALLAMGCVDLVIEPDLHDHDICAIIPIVEAAGGVITTWSGGPANEGGNVIAACTPELHKKALLHISSALKTASLI